MSKSQRLIVQVAGFGIRSVVHAILSCSDKSDRAEHVKLSKRHLSLMGEFVDHFLDAACEESSIPPDLGPR